MSTVKAEVASMLSSLPEDASLEDIQYHLYVLEKVKRGMEYPTSTILAGQRQLKWPVAGDCCG
jgi:hypothetical protein